MVQIRTALRRVGNSLGVIVPSEIVRTQKLHEGEKLTVNIQSKNITTVGKMLREARKQRLRFRRSTQEILKEVDEALE
jgi:antitoxin component of MazEF toxin-antitoxin module